MKITGTRSYMIVEIRNRKVKIQGELTSAPAFYASAGTIENWEPPFEKIKITEEEKNEIIQEVLAHNNPEFKIYFEG